ncbi:hypothetical protein FJY94_08610 [Candidatus Kaiserbacteria bacterium]|nr:hypothetical protein [Candidatus Kaiserbacteria bacterium]
MTDESNHTPNSASAELARLVRDFIGPAAKETGATIGDQLRYYRWRSAHAILERAKKYALSRGIPLREVPLKFLVPFIEKCSLEDENGLLADLWARLLANAAMGFEWKYTKYLELLSRIDGHDAQMLLEMFKTAHQSEAFSPERFSGPSWSEYLASQRLEDVLRRDRMAPNDWCAPGRWVFVIHEDDVANFNSMSLSGFDEGVRLLALQSLGLVYVHSGTYLYGANYDSRGKRYGN